MNSANKKIAKNTIYVYLRLFSTLIVGLYTSRIVLQILGVSDYGLFNVVGGILAMFTFISNSLSVATARFFNTEMGKPNGNLNKSFNINIVLHVFFAFLIALMAETIGLWYIYNKLNIADGKINDAVFVYHISIITAVLGIINNPYNSLFSAHERFGFLMKLDIIITFLRLFCVILLQYYCGQYALRWYCVIMCLTTVNTFFIYHLVAAKQWPDIIKLTVIKGWYNYKDILVYSNWNLLSTLSSVIRSSGCDLVINSFFGTAINGAYAISKSLLNYIVQFSASFDSAAGPQIIQSYASGNSERYTYLVNKMGRICLLLYELIFFPLFIELEYVLTLWLGAVPPQALIFAKLNLIVAGVSLSAGGIGQLINATSKIKWFKLESSFFFIMCIPATFIAFRFGLPAYTVLSIIIIADLIQRLIQLILLKIILNYDSVRFIKEAYSRPFLIAVIMIVFCCIYDSLNITAPLVKFLWIIIFFIITSCLVFYIGCSRNERKEILTRLKLK